MKFKEKMCLIYVRGVESEEYIDAEQIAAAQLMCIYHYLSKKKIEPDKLFIDLISEKHQSKKQFEKMMNCVKKNYLDKEITIFFYESKFINEEILNRLLEYCNCCIG